MVTIAGRAGVRRLVFGEALARQLAFKVYDFQFNAAFAEVIDRGYSVFGLAIDRLTGVAGPDIPGASVVEESKRMMQSAFAEGQAVVVGGCAAIALGRLPGTLHIFLTASEASRIAFSSEEQMSSKMAQTSFRKVERRRRLFARQFYRAGWRDSQYYDLIIDIERCGFDIAIDMVAQQVLLSRGESQC
jgi:cytidylate kinase